MNIAVSAADGEYILFLNAGDLFAVKDVLCKVSEFICNYDADILYGNVIEKDKEKSHLRVYTEKNCKMWYYSLGACLCHQGMFCKKELFQKKNFDINYRVCADREWQMYHIREGAVASAMKFAVAKVLVDGFAKEHVEELEEETRCCIKKYCGKWYIIYSIIGWLKKNKFFYFIIHKTEKKISCK